MAYRPTEVPLGLKHRFTNVTFWNGADSEDRTHRTAWGRGQRGLKADLSFSLRTGTAERALPVVEKAAAGAGWRGNRNSALAQLRPSRPQGRSITEAMLHTSLCRLPGGLDLVCPIAGHVPMTTGQDGVCQGSLTLTSLFSLLNNKYFVGS